MRAGDRGGSPGTPARVRRVPREESLSSAAETPGPPPGCAECPREVSCASHPALPSASHAFGWGESTAEPPSCPKPFCLFAGPPSQPSLYKGEKGDPGSRITDTCHQRQSSSCIRSLLTLFYNTSRKHIVHIHIIIKVII